MSQKHKSTKTSSKDAASDQNIRRGTLITTSTSITRKKNSRGRITMPLTPNKEGRREIRGLEIWVTITLSSANFTRREDTRPWTAKCSARGWPQNYSQEKSSKSPVSRISSVIPITNQGLIEPQRILLKGFSRVRNAWEDMKTKETTIIVACFSF